jgi:hypothetical protein
MDAFMMWYLVKHRDNFTLLSWVDPVAGLDAVVKGKRSLPLLEIEPRWFSP